MTKLRTPGRSHRLAIVGRTGSGKTQAGMFQLSLKNFEREGWTIIDTKGDPLIREIGNMDGVNHITLSEKPKAKGLNIVRPLPHQKDELNKFLWGVWTREGHGIYIDEAYMIEEPDSFLAILTQGRSKNVPVIVLSQRPRWVTRFIFSEADFFQMFNLQMDDDRATMANLTRGRYGNRTHLRDYHSLWYDVGKDSVDELSPVPPHDEILDAFAAKLKTRKVFV